MSDDWGDLESLPPPKSGVPRWLWFCGGGCLLMIVLALSAGWWSYTWVQKGRDVEANWTRLGEVMTFDARTQEHELNFRQTLPWNDFEVFVFIPNTADERKIEGDIVVFLSYPADTADELSSVEYEDADVEDFDLQVQGRVLEAVIVRGGESPAFPGMPQEAGQQVVATLSEDGADQRLQMIYIRQGSSDPVSADEIREFLAPFHVGPDR